MLARVEAIFRAVLSGAAALARFLENDPDAVHVKASAGALIESIPHHLYAGDTGLHLAAAALDPETAALLLDAGADPNAGNRRNARPLHYACDPRPGNGVAGRARAQASLIRLLVKGGADINAPDSGGATPLHRAVRARSPAAVRELLSLGARTDCILRRRGSSPLHLATQSTGAGGTAGTLAAQLEIIDLLLTHGADPAARDGEGQTPRDWARSPRVRESLDR